MGSDESCTIDRAGGRSSGQGGAFLTDPIKNFLTGNSSNAMDEIVEFGGLTFEEASVTILLPDGKTRTINLQAREGGQAMTQSLENLQEEDGDPTPESLEPRVAAVAENRARRRMKADPLPLIRGHYRTYVNAAGNGRAEHRRPRLRRAERPTGSAWGRLWARGRRTPRWRQRGPPDRRWTPRRFPVRRHAPDFPARPRLGG